MKFAKETQGTYSYLVYEIGDKQKIDEFSLGMLSNNKIPGVLSIIYTQMDNDKYFKYNISSKISVSEFFAGAVTKKRLLGVFESIVEAFISVDEYMISKNCLVLDLNYIYVDVSTCKAELAYLPLNNIDDQEKSVNMFLKEIMFSTKFEQTENCGYVAQIINYLNSSSTFNLYEFKKLLNKLQLDEKEEKHIGTQRVKEVKTEEKKEVINKKIVQENSKVEKKSVEQQETKKQAELQIPVARNKPVETPKKEKQISMFSLLMHYSKENKELYKQQKAEKVSIDKESKNNKQAKPKKNKQAAFSVPGANFAVPGMEQAAGNLVLGDKIQNKEQTIKKEVENDNVEKKSTIQASSKSVEVPMDFGETTILGGNLSLGETTVLSATKAAEQQILPHLIRIKNNEKIPINKPRYRIGKERSYVDYFIGDNTAISRSHADIINNGGRYTIVDMNSTNHTYVNNEMIQSGTEVELKHGDKLRLANEDFEFRLY